MKNADMPAMPVLDDHISTHEAEIYYGLTKFEECVFRAMQGLLSNPNKDYDPDGLAHDAVEIATAVMERFK